MKDEFRRDWDVSCQKGSFARKYGVHWLVRDYGPNHAGNGMVEILYWVTDHQTGMTAPGHFVGTTLRMKLKTYSTIDNIEMTVDVDNIAGLDMSL